MLLVGAKRRGVGSSCAVSRRLAAPPLIEKLSAPAETVTLREAAVYRSFMTKKEKTQLLRILHSGPCVNSLKRNTMAKRASGRNSKRLLNRRAAHPLSRIY